jgi:predicted XRE-type DNA-binding protein
MRPDDATVHALRADLALQIARHLACTGGTQVAAAARLGVPQPTLSRIVNGQVGELSLELLLRIAVRAGLPVVLQTGAEPLEAGAYVARKRSRERPQPSMVGDGARVTLLEGVARLGPEQRLEAQLEHSALLGELHAAAVRCQGRRGRPAGSARPPARTPAASAPARARALSPRR